MAVWGFCTIFAGRMNGFRKGLELFKVHQTVKKLAEFIRHIENFRNFVLGEHSDYCLYYFMFEHHKGTTIFANHQIYRQLNFVELTLYYQLLGGLLLDICHMIEDKPI